MEAIILYAHLLHELESGIHLVLSGLHRAGCGIPREGLCSSSELVGTFRTESMPPRHGEFEPLAHFLAEHNLVSVIITESHRIAAFPALKTDLADFREKFFVCHNFMLSVSELIYASRRDFHRAYAPQHASKSAEDGSMTSRRLSVEKASLLSR